MNGIGDISLCDCRQGGLNAFGTQYFVGPFLEVEGTKSLQFLEFFLGLLRQLLCIGEIFNLAIQFLASWVFFSNSSAVCPALAAASFLEVSALAAATFFLAASLIFCFSASSLASSFSTSAMLSMIHLLIFVESVILAGIRFTVFHHRSARTFKVYFKVFCRFFWGGKTVHSGR